MRKLFYIMCLIASACASPEKKGVSVVDLDAAETRDVNLSSLIDNARIIPLETNEKCLIAHRFVCFADDFILVGTFNFSSIELMRLLRFDINGRYLNEIGKAGRGPGEHTGEPQNIRYIKDEKLILVSWGGQYADPQVFDLSGNFVRDIHQPSVPTRGGAVGPIERINDSIWFGYSFSFIYPGNAVDSTMVYFFTSDGKPVKRIPRSIVPVKPGAAGGLEWTPSRYLSDGIWKFYTDETHTLSRIEDMTFVPEIVFKSENFADYHTMSRDELLNGKLGIRSISERENYFLLLKSKISRPEERAFDIPLSFVDKSSMQATNLRLNDDVFHVFPGTYFNENWNVRNWDDGRIPFQDNLMYLIVNPEILIPMLKNKSGEATPEIQTELDKLKNLKETDNPVIFLFTLKDRIDKL